MEQTGHITPGVGGAPGPGIIQGLTAQHGTGGRNSQELARSNSGPEDGAQHTDTIVILLVYWTLALFF